MQSENNKRYQDAIKQVNAKKTDSFILVEIAYDRKFILPYKKGIEFMSCLEGALVYQERYSSPPIISEINNEVAFRPLSEQELTDIKVAQLLRIPLDEAKSLRE